MRYFKNLNEYGSLISLEKRSTASSGKEITEAEYNNILEVIRNRPTAPDGYGYKLTDSTEWELYELPTADDDEEVTSEEALAELMEVLT